jgi:hypothetical protein
MRAIVQPSITICSVEWTYDDGQEVRGGSSAPNYIH